ncbi:MAG: translation initiation factor IF-2 subunit gamma [Nanopusillaceae archaeon]
MNNIYPDLSIVILGHVDHGKTTLAKVLTDKWLAKHSEELKRGLTIKLGYSNFSIYKCPEHGYFTKNKCPICGKENIFVRKLSLLDAPGHEALLSVMLSGAAIVDAAILVIAANEEVPQPQTLEHLLAFKSLGNKPLLVVQNKIDLVSKEDAIKNYNKILEFLESLGFKENIKIIPISAINDINIEYVLEWLVNLKTPTRDLKSDPLFLITRSFDVNKPGTLIKDLKGGVLGGSLIKGKIKLGDEIEIKPGLFIDGKWKPIRTKVKNLMQGDYNVEEIIPGGTSSIETYLDPFLTKDDTLAGQIATYTEKAYNMVEKITLKYEKIRDTQKDLKIDEEIFVVSYNMSSIGKIIEKKENEITIILKRPILADPENKIAILAKINNRWSLYGIGYVR